MSENSTRGSPMHAPRDKSVPAWLDRSSAFSDQRGIPRPRIAVRQRRLLRRLPALGPIIELGERALWVTSAAAPVACGGGLTPGRIAGCLRRHLLLFTNRRILVVPGTGLLPADNRVSEIRYSACRELRLHGHRLVVRYLSGEREQVPLVAAPERPRIAQFLEQVNFDLSTGRVARNGAIGRHRLAAAPEAPAGKPARGIAAGL